MTLDTLLIIGLGFALPFGLFMLMQSMLDQRRMTARIARVTHRGGGTATTAVTAGRTSLRKQQEKTTAFGSLLVRMLPSEARLRARLTRAGIPLTLDRYLLACAGLTLVAMLLLQLFLGKGWLISALLGVVVGVGIPYAVIGHIGNKRMKKFVLLFPDALDLIVRGLRAGLPVAESIKMVASEISPPVGEVFGQITERVALGVSLENALREASRQLDLTEFNFFVTTLNLQRETGGNLSEVLDNLGSVLRQRVMMRMKIRALSSEARASAYIVGALPFIVLGILTFQSPEYLAPLFEDPRGNNAGIGAALSMMLGIGIMVKMTKFEI